MVGFREHVLQVVYFADILEESRFEVKNFVGDWV